MISDSGLADEGKSMSCVPWSVILPYPCRDAQFATRFRVGLLFYVGAL